MSPGAGTGEAGRVGSPGEDGEMMEDARSQQRLGEGERKDLPARGFKNLLNVGSRIRWA